MNKGRRDTFGLNEIALSIETWIEFSEKDHISSGLEIKDSNRVTPHLSNRGVLQNWVKVLRGEKVKGMPWNPGD